MIKYFLIHCVILRISGNKKFAATTTLFDENAILFFWWQLMRIV